MMSCDSRYVYLYVLLAIGDMRICFDSIGRLLAIMFLHEMKQPGNFAPMLPCSYAPLLLCSYVPVLLDPWPSVSYFCDISSGKRTVHRAWVSVQQQSSCCILSASSLRFLLFAHYSRLFRTVATVEPYTGAFLRFGGVHCPIVCVQEF